MSTRMRGGFTLPGEAGYEALTLSLAEKWGADVIRDSDGTRLSDEIVRAGYGIYSTICIIRQHNAFAEAHPDSQQQTFLSSDPVMAEGSTLILDPMAGFFREQFEPNTSPAALRYWQVWDRTAGTELSRDCWTLREDGRVQLTGCTPWHRYTVSFLAWRIWEEINMYNHTTNHWTSEHLRQLDPRHPEACAYLCGWLEDWCRANPDTTVVRFTSLFYNFVWIFGEDLRRRTRYCDWASYDFTVSPAALQAFEQQTGQALTAEDFIRQGHLQPTHRPPTPAKRAWMDFIQAFVAERAKALVEIVHRYGKKAYVFYDDSWVGLEPNGPRFREIGFDGLIKCIFSGFECRLCANAQVPTHEIRLHPYLFPVGLGGLPTFSEGGHPERDARAYWVSARRALVRKPVDRIGLGGYLHLTEGYPAFVDAIADIADEFRRIKALHEAGEPETLPLTAAVLTTWGELRAWTCSGHFHETYMHPLIHVLEALSGLPVRVKFLTFAEAADGGLSGVDAVISAGRAGDAWSGGEAWADTRLVDALTRFVWEGGTLLGIGEPSALPGGDTFFRMAHVLGVDEDNGVYVCHSPWSWETQPDGTIPLEAGMLGANPAIRLTDGEGRVLAEAAGAPQAVVHAFGKGRGIYLSDFQWKPGRALALLRLLNCGRGELPGWVSMDPRVETAWYPASGTLVALNNADEPVTLTLCPDGKPVQLALAPLETKILQPNA